MPTVHDLFAAADPDHGYQVRPSQTVKGLTRAFRKGQTLIVSEELYTAMQKASRDEDALRRLLINVPVTELPA